MNGSVHIKIYPLRRKPRMRSRRLALDMSWSWNHSADEIWKRLDPELWELTGNPWLIVQSMSKRKLEALKREFLTDTAFRQRVEQLLAELNEKNAAPAWFQTAHPSTPLRGVAYFSMEYMLSEALSDLLWRPRKRRRRSVESRKRPGRSGGRYRAPLSTGVFPSGTRRPRRPAGSLSGERTGAIADSQSAHIRRRAAQNGADAARRKGLDSHLGGAGRTNQAVFARRQRSCQSSKYPSNY